jgi:segregation and condensation protein B
MNPIDEPIEPLAPKPADGSEIDSSQQEVSPSKPKVKRQGKKQTALDTLVDKYAEPNEGEGEGETDTDPAAYDDIEPTSSQGDNAPGAIDDELDIADSDQGDPYGGHSPERLKNILEAALFASGTTLSASHLRALFEAHERPHGRIVRQLMAELIAHHSGRGLLLVEVASGYRFQTATDTAPWVARLWEEKPQRYSRALMETIALIAYRQPITRGEIEDVRGVAVSSNIIRTLLEREWVRVVGHRDVPGRPAMYATTRQFLDYFSLMTLDQMPSLGEIRDMEELNPQLHLTADNDENASEDKQQAEISFSGLIEKIRDSAVSGKTGNEFIDEQLDQELQAMDKVNANFEQALAQQKAEHEHPDLQLDYDDTDSTTPEPADTDPLIAQDSVDMPAPADELVAELEPPLSEEEQWKSIQQKLAQQQALLDARENDSQREENDNE